VNSQTWTGGGLSYQIAILTRGDAGGAFARIGKSGAPAARASFARSPRDFGAVNLDRSFEQNRLALSTAQSGDAIEVKDKDELTSIAQPAAEYPINTALLRKEPSEDLVAALALVWPADRSINALNRLALPLWAAYGPSRIEGIQDAAGDRLVLTWENSTTRVRLRLSFDESSPELVAEDSRGPSALKERAEAADKLDRRERRDRIAARKPRTRLSRSLTLSEHGIDNLRLGMTRQQVQAALPASRSIRLLLIESGVSVLFLNEPPPTATHWPRQLLIRSARTIVWPRFAFDIRTDRTPPARTIRDCWTRSRRSPTAPPYRYRLRGPGCGPIFLPANRRCCTAGWTTSPA
jgi:hypothetical protein